MDVDTALWTPLGDPARVRSTTTTVLAGWSAVVAFAATLPTIALYFVSPGAPPVGNVLARTVVDTAVCCALLLFVTSWADVVRGWGRRSDWLAGPVAGAGLVFVALTLTADALQAGAVLHSGGGIDPTLIGSGAENSQVIYSPLARSLTALFLTLSAVAVLRGGVLPRGLGWAALGIAAFHLALVPALFRTAGPSEFYSINGWSIPVAGGLFLGWVLAAGCCLLRNRHR